MVSLRLGSDFDGNERGRREVVWIVGPRRVFFVLDFLEVARGRAPWMTSSLIFASERGCGEGGRRGVRWREQGPSRVKNDGKEGRLALCLERESMR